VLSFSSFCLTELCDAQLGSSSFATAAIAEAINAQEKATPEHKQEEVTP